VLGKTYYDIPAKAGETMMLADNQGSIAVVKAYSNFKLRGEDEGMVPYDSEEPGSNPAWELVYTSPEGQTKSYYVFENIQMHPVQNSSFHVEYLPPRMIKDYKSTLEVIDGDQVVRQATIEVNKPLYYGGYHFYQSTFAYNEIGPVSGIQVTSARGVWTVFFGYAVIFAGLVVQFWSKLRKMPQREAAGGPR
jgi:cytochrome c biogenesis protein ResB